MSNPTPKPMLNVANAMLLISTLCARGWTVRFTGMMQAEVQITSSEDEVSDFAFVAFGDTTEEALLDAARRLHAELGETLRLVGSCLPDGVTG